MSADAAVTVRVSLDEMIELVKASPEFTELLALVKDREKRIGELQAENEALRLVVVGVAQRLWQCDFATEMDAVELLYDAEKEEEAMYEPALVAACEVLLGAAKTKVDEESGDAKDV